MSDNRFGPVQSTFVSVEESRAGYQPGPAASELKGQALDDALEAAGLSKSGKVEEKQARLAEHQAPVIVADSTTTDGGTTAGTPEEGSA